MEIWHYRMVRVNNSIDRAQILYKSSTFAIQCFNSQNDSVTRAGARHNKPVINVS